MTFPIASVTTQQGAQTPTYPQLLLASQRFGAVDVFERAYLFFELICFPAQRNTNKNKKLKDYSQTSKSQDNNIEICGFVRQKKRWVPENRRFSGRSTDTYFNVWTAAMDTMFGPAHGTETALVFRSGDDDNDNNNVAVAHHRPGFPSTATGVRVRRPRRQRCCKRHIFFLKKNTNNCAVELYTPRVRVSRKFIRTRRCVSLRRRRLFVFSTRYHRVISHYTHGHCKMLNKTNNNELVLNLSPWWKYNNISMNAPRRKESLGSTTPSCD